MPCVRAPGRRISRHRVPVQGRLTLVSGPPPEPSYDRAHRSPEPKGATMTAPTAHDANPYLGSDAAARLLVDLRRSTDGRTGDRLSGAIRAVTTSGSTLPSDQVDAAIAAIALLLTDYEPALLDGAQDETGLRAWLH